MPVGGLMYAIDNFQVSRLVMTSHFVYKMVEAVGSAHSANTHYMGRSKFHTAVTIATKQ